MKKNNLLGKTLSKSFTLNIKILELDKDVPDGEQDNLIDWIKDTAIENCLGKQDKYYGYSEDYKDDILVKIDVNYSINKLNNENKNLNEEQSYLEAKMEVAKYESKQLNKNNVISHFSSLEECENEAISFIKDKLKVVNGFLSEDYKIGYKEGIEHYLASKTINDINPEEKILTIKKINFVGKWVEFWFEEEFPTITGEVDAYQLSSKGYKLWDALSEANLENLVMNNGFVGTKLKWRKEGFNWEIVGFV